MGVCGASDGRFRSEPCEEMSARVPVDRVGTTFYGRRDYVEPNDLIFSQSKVVHH